MMATNSVSKISVSGPKWNKINIEWPTRETLPQPILNGRDMVSVYRTLRCKEHLT